MAITMKIGYTKEERIHNDLIKVLSRLGVLSKQETAQAERGLEVTTVIQPGTCSNIAFEVKVTGTFEIIEVPDESY